MMSHMCFTVDNIEQMRTYLRSKGFDVKAGRRRQDQEGDYAFEIKDPDGMLVEFVQSLPTGVEAQAAGKFMPPTRISDEDLPHRFSGREQPEVDRLLRQDAWASRRRGAAAANPKELSWINMKVPDGDDYVEFMLYREPADQVRDQESHFARRCQDIDKAVAELESRPAFKTYGKDLKIATGREPEAPSELVRSGRDASGTDGAVHGDGQADAVIDRAATASGARLIQRTATRN